MFKLIAFTGKAGAGKNTAAECLIKLRYIEESFAKRPKEGVAKMFGLTPEQVFGTKEQKEKDIPWLSVRKPVSPRLILQTLCTEWGRDIIDPDIWVYPVQKTWDTMKNIPGFAGMVITDLRFNNEAEWVKSQGGVIVEVHDAYDKSESDYVHVSENGVDQKYVDIKLPNFKDGVDVLHSNLLEGLAEHERRLNVAKSFTQSRAAIQTAYQSRCTCGSVNDSTRKDVRQLITEWADEVFPSRTVTNAISKMVLEEIPEFLHNQQDPMELADIGILLYDIAHLSGIDLDSAIRDKMKINRERVWQVDKVTGLMKHIKSPHADVQASESEGGEA